MDTAITVGSVKKMLHWKIVMKTSVHCKSLTKSNCIKIILNCIMKTNCNYINIYCILISLKNNLNEVK